MTCGPFDLGFLGCPPLPPSVFLLVGALWCSWGVLFCVVGWGVSSGLACLFTMVVRVCLGCVFGFRFLLGVWCCR